MDLPKVTLFSLMSVDGKISTGPYDNNDFDLDIPRISELKAGVQQYYEIEKETDAFCLVTGKTMAKLGVNSGALDRGEVPVTCVVLDNKQLSWNGVINLCDIYERVILFTMNKDHQALTIDRENLYMHILPRFSMRFVLETLADVYNCEALTLQSGGTVTSKFLKEQLIDELNIVVAPMLVGGWSTPTLVDGGVDRNESTDLNRIGLLELKSVCLLKDSYLNLKYKVHYSQKQKMI